MKKGEIVVITGNTDPQHYLLLRSVGKVTEIDDGGLHVLGINDHHVKIKQWLNPADLRPLQVGDFVRYTIKKELGLVGEVTEHGARCWWHLGGTRAMCPYEILEVIATDEAITGKFSNQYAKASLIERKYRLQEGGDVSDLIDRDEIRTEILEALNHEG